MLWWKGPTSTICRLEKTSEKLASVKTYLLSQKIYLNEIQGMSRVVLYKHINYTVDRLLPLALVTIYITNYSIIIIFL